MRRPLAFISVLLIAACGSPADIGVETCDPLCPPGQHCTATGCELNEPYVAPDLAVAGPADLAGSTCSPECSGATPFCNAKGLCVRCLANGDCPDGQVCVAVGATSTCVPGCIDDARCGGGTARCCAGRCVDTAKDPANCGACAMPCGGEHVTASCEAGVCVPGACHRGYGDCNANSTDGCETRLDQDPAHCNGCGKRCAITNAVAGCAGITDDNPTGCYLRGCHFGFDDCNGDQEDGCEQSVSSDPKNCGQCGYACPKLANAEVACVTATCTLAACNAGFSDCDRDSKTGCEVATGTDKNNCGVCGARCDQGLACINGACTCQQCNIANAKTKCVNNMCVFDECVKGFADCDNNLNNGCEVVIASDAKNCGACGNECPMNLPGCSEGVCVLGWFPKGVQENVPVETLAGWKECFRDTYNQSATSLAQIEAQCSGSKVMMACAPTGVQKLSLVAWAGRESVFKVTAPYDCTANQPVTQANDVGFYYADNSAMGFVKGGDGAELCSCDTAGQNANYRMCWHTGKGRINEGYRCGNVYPGPYDRIMYHIQ